MKIEFPSAAFDDGVAAVCHGLASDDQMLALNELLRSDSSALAEYVLRVELHSRLASAPELFVSAFGEGALLSDLVGAAGAPDVNRCDPRRRRFPKHTVWASCFAAAAILLAAVAGWKWLRPGGRERPVATSQAVAMLSQTIDAQWRSAGESPRLGAPLDPGWLKLDSGMAQIVFYSGARLAIEGPAELQLLSASAAVCSRGKITAEVPPEARGFRLQTPQGAIIDLGTAFGVEVKPHDTELQVFKGVVRLETESPAVNRMVREGTGLAIGDAAAPRLIAPDRTAYTGLLDIREKSRVAEADRLKRWQAASRILNRDRSLVLRLDFDHAGASSWQLMNVALDTPATAASIVGCQFTNGRWPGKRALEFQSVNDRVRASVPGEFAALTFAAWVRVQGLDRKLNSLFMSDGFAPGTVHWLIRNDGVLGLTVVGPGRGDYEIVTSPPAITLDRLGTWVHLAVVLDGRTGRVAHYLNGRTLADRPLRIAPPYRVGSAELGNWNCRGFPEGDPLMIRNFSGAIDEFCVFRRALGPREIQSLYAEGTPDREVVALRRGPAVRR